MPFGMESRQLYLSREWVKRGYDVHVYTSVANHQLTTKPQPGVDTIDGINVHWLKTKPYNNVYGLGRIWSWFEFEWRLRKKLKRTEFKDVKLIIVSSLSLLSILNGIYLKQKYKAKLVIEIRDIWPLILTEITSVSKRHPLYLMLAWVEKRGYQHADLIVGTMDNLGEHVQNTIHTNVPVLHIPHLLNTHLESVNEHAHAPFLANLRANGTKTIIAYSSASIGKSVGLQHFLEAADVLSGLNVALVILGNGPLKAHYKSAFTQENIFFLDRIPQNQLVAFLKDCDILYDGYLKSDIYRFGSSRNKNVEYCLAAKPMIISYAGYPLFIEKYNCGTVVEPENTNAILQAVKDMLALSTSERDAIGARALAYAQTHLTIAPYIDSLLSTLQLEQH